MFINIHSHNAAAPNEWTVQSLHKDWERVSMPGRFSLGIHPWYIEKDCQQQFSQMKQWVHHPHAIAIGECGLDKVCTTDFSMQENVFKEQIQLAVTLQKPLIIHCVRAWEEVFSLLKKAAPLKAIFHGFAKNAELARRIINRGYYISLGKELEKESMKEVIRLLPPDKIFLETDDASLSITTVYEWAAKALGIGQNSLCLQLQKNAEAVFGTAAIST
jgi:TatD DNase family protein